MREPRRFPRPRRHVTPSQKPSSPEKLTRPIPQRSAPPPRLAAERLHPQSRKTCRPSETHTFAIPPEERAAPAARGRTVASTNQENMSRKSPATASTKQKNMSPFRKTYIRHSPKERAAPRLAVERLRPQSRKTCRENPLQPHSQSRKTCRPSEKHTFAIPQRSAPLHAARGRTVASTNQENMSRKSPATATATALTIVPVCC